MTHKKAQQQLALLCYLASQADTSTRAEITQALDGMYSERRDSQRKMLTRDITDLKTLGIPITWAPKQQGYILEKSDLLQHSRLILSAEEVQTLLRAARLTGGEASHPFWAEFRLILAQLEAEDYRIQPQSKAVDIFHPSERCPQLEQSLNLLTEAIWERHLVHFDYSYPHSTSPHPRRIAPWALRCWRGHWVCVAHCLDRGARRTFRVSRMAQLELAGHRQPALAPPPDFSILTESNLQPWDWELHPPCSVQLQGAEAILELVGRQLGVQPTGQRLCRSTTNLSALLELVLDWAPRVRIVGESDALKLWNQRLNAISSRHRGTP